LRISFETAATNAYQLVNIRMVIQELMAAKNIGGERKAVLGEAFSGFPLGICAKMARKIPFRLIGFAFFWGGPRAA
jgi:hypothetical protein